MLTMLFPANRSLEDMDAYYRTNPPLIVTTDPDAISRKRPQKYIEREDQTIERSAANKGLRLRSSVDATHVEQIGEEETKN
jgi:hypothetical protein